MSKLGTRWMISGIPAAFISRLAANGRYRVIFERSETDLDAIESINWSSPDVTAVGEGGGEGLPEGYGFDLVDLTYLHTVRCFAAELKTAAQHLGDVSAYQAQVSSLEAQVAAQETAAAELKQQLHDAYEEGVESHG